MMMSYFKGTADAVAEHCTAVSCPNTPWNINKHLPYQLTPMYGMFLVLAQAEMVHAVSRRRMANSST